MKNELITILLLIFGISVFIFVVSASYNILVNAYFKNRFLKALKRGEVKDFAEILQNNRRFRRNFTEKPFS